jgi:16S rRNA (cytosine1402-N4)-methyltransferase
MTESPATTIPPAPPEPAAHLPVLLTEVLGLLAPRAGGRYCDATVGYGGHARGVLEASGPDGSLWGLDRDQDALDAARVALAPFGSRVQLVHSPFSRMATVLADVGVPALDGCLVDLGVSSPQLDRDERGFSFRKDGPLDMRMDRSTGETAADYLARVDEQDLADVLRDLGEERFSGRIARHIVEARQRGRIETTAALADLVARAIPRREHHKNPATRTFQALRIAINQELFELERFLEVAPTCLRPGGRLLVISFHSLEDRMVKRRWKALAGGEGDRPAGAPFQVLTKRPLVASDEEVARNPRARSAKLRAIERVDPAAAAGEPLSKWERRRQQRERQGS